MLDFGEVSLDPILANFPAMMQPCTHNRVCGEPVVGRGAAMEAKGRECLFPDFRAAL